MKVSVWPNLVAEVGVRVLGIDAPETRNPGCVSERELGLKAKTFVEDRYKVGDIVQVRSVGPDSFFGRVVADVRRWRSDRWLPLSKELLDEGLAVEWTPSQEAVPWCLLSQDKVK